jgi:hypothetical protein
MSTSVAARQRDGSARSTAADYRFSWHEDDEQCTMDSIVCSRAAATLVRGGTLLLYRTHSVRSDA